MDSEYISYLWKFLVLGYLFTIAVETPVLVVGLSPCHPMRRRVFAGVWLTACTYPIVVLVLPQFFDPGKNRVLFLAVAETFAPLAECALFWAAFGQREEKTRKAMWRDLAVIVLANLLSFGIGEVAHERQWFDPLLPLPRQRQEQLDDRVPEAVEGETKANPEELPAPSPSHRLRAENYKSARFSVWGCTRCNRG
jgi:hypothetical protein